jgi:hypothetical protein
VEIRRGRTGLCSDGHPLPRHHNESRQLVRVGVGRQIASQLRFLKAASQAGSAGLSQHCQLAANRVGLAGAR